VAAVREGCPRRRPAGEVVLQDVHGIGDLASQQAIVVEVAGGQAGRLRAVAEEVSQEEGRVGEDRRPRVIVAVAAAEGRPLALVREAVAVAVVRSSASDVATVWDAVLIAVLVRLQSNVARVGTSIAVAVEADAALDVALVGDEVPVAVAGDAVRDLSRVFEVVLVAVEAQVESAAAIPENAPVLIVEQAGMDRAADSGPDQILRHQRLLANKPPHRRPGKSAPRRRSQHLISLPETSELH
jgi:hypothetical protein